jgi:hypothetical protein
VGLLPEAVFVRQVPWFSRPEERTITLSPRLERSELVGEEIWMIEMILSMMME